MQTPRATVALIVATILYCCTGPKTPVASPDAAAIIDGGPCASDGGTALAPFERVWATCGGMFYVGGDIATKNGISFYSIPRFHDTKVMSIDANGTILFETVLPGGVSTAAIDGNGIAYFNHGGVELLGYKTSGSPVTRVSLVAEKPTNFGGSEPAIGEDGTVFASVTWYDSGSAVDATNETEPRVVDLLVAVKDGALLWTRPDEGFTTPPVIDSQGMVWGATGAKLKRFSPDGLKQWERDLTFAPAVYSAGPLAIGPNDTARLFVVGGDGIVGAEHNNDLQFKLFAVNSSGEVLWDVEFSELKATEGPVRLSMDARGNTIVAVALNMKPSAELASFLGVVGPEGTVVARYQMNGFQLYPPLIALSDGTTLVAGSEPYQSGERYLMHARLYRFDTKLNIVENKSWQRPNQTSRPIDYMSLGSCGEIYLVGAKMDATDPSDGSACFYKFLGSPGLTIANSPWPLERGDMARTGRVQVVRGD